MVGERVACPFGLVAGHEARSHGGTEDSAEDGAPRRTRSGQGRCRSGVAAEEVAAKVASASMADKVVVAVASATTVDKATAMDETEMATPDALN